MNKSERARGGARRGGEAGRPRSERRTYAVDWSRAAAAALGRGAARCLDQISISIEPEQRAGAYFADLRRRPRSEWKPCAVVPFSRPLCETSEGFSPGQPCPWRSGESKG